MKNTKPSLDVLSNGKIFVNLPLRARSRVYIGKFKRHTFYSIKKDKRKSLFKKLDSYAIPLDLFKVNKNLFYICLKLRDGNKIFRRWASKELFNLKGKILQFHTFEAQVFLNKSLWKDSLAEVKRERKILRRRIAK